MTLGSFDTVNDSPIKQIVLVFPSNFPRASSKHVLDYKDIRYKTQQTIVMLPVTMVINQAEHMNDHAQEIKKTNNKFSGI